MMRFEDLEVWLYAFRAHQDKERLREEAVELLKQLYGREASISVIYDMDIPPETSGKYLISKTLFPIDLDNYLDR